MAVIVTNRDDSFEAWRLKTNEDSANMGDIETLYTTDVLDIIPQEQTAVDAINDLNDRKVKRTGDTITGQLKLTAAQPATSFNTGSLVVTGGVGVSGNVYSTGNIYGTWQGGIVSTDKGGTGLSAIGTGHQLLSVNSGATGLEYKTVNGGIGINVSYGANTMTITSTGEMPTSSRTDNEMKVGQNLLVGSWNGTGHAATTTTNALEVRIASTLVPTLQNLLSLATDVNNAAGAFTVFNVSKVGSLTIGANKMTVDAATGATNIAGPLTVSGVTTLSSIVISQNLQIDGNLTVNGANTTINASALTLADPNIEIGAVVAGANDSTANGGGLTLRGATSKTITWASTGANWTSSENMDLVAGKSYKIANTQVLNATTLGSGIIYSSLTQVGTITSGEWKSTTAPVGIAYGGTGATTAVAAVNNLIVAGLPTGQPGQALLTSGTSLYWGTPTSTTTVGTTIVSNRTYGTGNGSTTSFTTPQYTAGTGQLRVYINGVRQHMDAGQYTEATGTTVTITPAPPTGASIMFEVDGYNNYVVTAGTVTTTSISGLLGASNVQTALETLNTTKANLASPSLTGTPTAPTAAVDNNSTTIATTAWMLGQAGTSVALINGVASAGSSLRWSRMDHIHPTDTSRAAVASPTFTGTVTLPVGSTTVQPLRFQAGSKLTTPIAHSVEWDGSYAYFTKSDGNRYTNVVADGTTYNIAISGQAGSVANGVYNNGGSYGINITGRGYPRRSDGGDINFYWSAPGGQPSYVWGGSDGTNMYVYAPSTLNVNYATSAGTATSAGNADTVDGSHLSDILSSASSTATTIAYGAMPAIMNGWQYQSGVIINSSGDYAYYQSKVENNKLYIRMAWWCTHSSVWWGDTGWNVVTPSSYAFYLAPYAGNTPGVRAYAGYIQYNNNGGSWTNSLSPFVTAGNTLTF